MNLSRDYISGLPDELLTSILSLVGTKEAVQSCLLAKRWRKPWTFVPLLKFDLNEFLTNDVDVNKKERRMECEDKFKLFVNSVLENRGTSSVDSIQYKSMISDNCSEASMQWLDRALLLIPRAISVSVERDNDIFDFPNSVFSCASLEKLELDFNTQERTIINPMYISLPALKCLDLCGANIDDEFLHNLFSGCPSLELLVLHVCDIVFTGICPLSSNVLKELALHQCWHSEHIQISCPCLDSLVIDCDGEGGGISLENMVSLTNAEFRFSFAELDSDLSLLKGLSNVSTLRLEFLDAEFQRLLEYDMHNCTTFNNLKSLKIARWDASSDFDLMACFIKHSPSLQEIILDLSERQKCILEEEPNQEELHEVLFQREHLETIRIRRSGNQDVFVNRLINNFCAHIKNIGKIIVKWIRVLYSDFKTFTEDQEMLIAMEKTFDYLEGFVIINRTDLVNNWRSSFKPEDPVLASQFKSDGKILFCLEMTKNYNPEEAETMELEVIELLSRLRYMTEVTYMEFLDRVHVSEVKLRSQGLWEVPHPWLNLLIPRSKIHEFSKEVFGKILTDTSNGPILLYPVSRAKWDNRTSVVLPEVEEEVFYLVAFLNSAPPPSPSSEKNENLEIALEKNKKILEFCHGANIGMKQYLPHHTTQEQWRAHFGDKWETFRRKKQAYDPLSMLAPGQGIFYKTPMPLL